MLTNFVVGIKLRWKHFKLTWRYKFAHHPLCDRYSNQVFRFKGVYLCQGCTLIYGGGILSFVVFLLLPREFFPVEFIGWFYTALLLISPTFVVEVFKLSRPLKRIARILNGITIGFWARGFFYFSDWIIKIGIILLTVFFYYLFKLTRKIKGGPADLCVGCPELVQGTICSGYKPIYEKEKEYSQYATKLLEPYLRDLVYKKMKEDKTFVNMAINKKENEKQ